MLRIVFFRYEKRKEHRVHSALFGARQIELTVAHALADIAAVIKLTIDNVNVRIKREYVGRAHQSS
jgi:hypothetical protein